MLDDCHGAKLLGDIPGGDRGPIKILNSLGNP